MRLYCEFIKELAPLKAMGASGKLTNRLIKKHVCRCAECREYVRLCEQVKDRHFGYLPDAAAEKDGYDLLEKALPKSIALERLIKAVYAVTVTGLALLFVIVRHKAKRRNGK